MRGALGVLVVAVLGGCGSMPEREVARAVPAPVVRGETAQPDRGDGLSSDAVIRRSLYAQYAQWKDTPYRIGGLGRDGVDCSGFMHVTFSARFGMTLPRSTDLQVHLGEDVDRSQLRTGDLVFFKTGTTLRHVGVYLEDDRFLHASTSRGVTISRLSEAYWRAAYWKAKRLDISP
ncbi:NlpC/P60 family protein [Nitrosovibrio sp. Nv17]|jgi:cell wall-associated NlpC family hydrolase|uniref:NlpC/P60 family protein n=1 Tax=Nitrosovibrio sp. Nv17 TaxID=1855339 RepID=UPI0009F869FC|nr:NlpC/P60 family protein [Nitrosovibrio sp. Nv17]